MCQCMYVCMLTVLGTNWGPTDKILFMQSHLAREQSLARAQARIAANRPQSLQTALLLLTLLAHSRF